MLPKRSVIEVFSLSHTRGRCVSRFERKLTILSKTAKTCIHTHTAYTHTHYVFDKSAQQTLCDECVEAPNASRFVQLDGERAGERESKSRRVDAG